MLVCGKQVTKCVVTCVRISTYLVDKEGRVPSLQRSKTLLQTFTLLESLNTVIQCTMTVILLT